MVIELGDTPVADGAVLRPDRPPEQARAAESPARRVEVIPFAPFCQLDDGPEPLLLRDNDDTGIGPPALPEVVPEQTGQAEIHRGGQRADELLQ